MNVYYIFYPSLDSCIIVSQLFTWFNLSVRVKLNMFYFLSKSYWTSPVTFFVFSGTGAADDN